MKAFLILLGLWCLAFLTLNIYWAITNPLNWWTAVFIFCGIVQAAVFSCCVVNLIDDW